MTDWVPMMAPPQLAPRFLKEIAEYVGRTDAEADPRLWEDATGNDIGEFLKDMNGDQYKVLRCLAFSSVPRSTSEHAERLHMAVGHVAGCVGPINKRAKKLGWISPVRSNPYWNGRSSSKVLQLDSHVALFIREHDDGDS